MQAIEILTISGAAIGTLLSLHLFLLNKTKASAFLGFYVLSLSVLLIEPLATSLQFTGKIVAVFMGISAFVAGPAIYLYCLSRIRRKPFSPRWLSHFIPAILLAGLIIVSPESEKSLNESEDEIILYLLFVAQMVSYLTASFRLTTQRQHGTPHIADQMPQSFVTMLVYSSIALFTFSFLSTFIGWNKGNVFVTSVQVLLNIVIIVIALLNTDGLEQRPKNDFVRP
jgi:hypothetical protein